MSSTIASTEDLESLVAAAKAVDSPHVDLSGVLGLESRLLVGVDSLHEAILNHELPTVSLEYRGTTIEVSRQDGGVMATLEVHF